MAASLFIAASALPARSFAQETVTVSFQDGVAPTTGYAGTTDTKIKSDTPNTTGGTSTTLEVDGSPDRAGLLKWDLSAIPVGAAVQSVSMTLNVTDGTSDAYEVYEVLRDWSESQATWNVFATGSPWQVAGAQGTLDRGTTVLATVGPSATGAGTYLFNASGVALVQRWVTTPSSNFGLIVQDYVNASNGIDFNSSEVATPTLRPKLTVAYSVPTALPTVTIIWTDPLASESGDTGALRINRTGAWTAPLQVYFTVAGTASNGLDYQTLTSPVTIPAGAQYVTIVVAPLQDALVEGNEYVALTLAPNPAYVIGTANSANVSIADDDVPTNQTVSFQDGVAPTSSYAGTRDTRIRSDAANTNYGASTTLEVDGYPDRSALLRWDVSAIPAGSVVEEASITLNVTDGSSQTYQLYELKRDWVEGQTTWNVFATGAPWQVAGAQGTLDRGTTSLGTVGPTGTGLNTFALNAAGRALVQQWAANPSSNFGLIVQQYSGTSNGIDFSSSEVATATLRPRLTVTYSAGSPPLPTVTVAATDPSATESGGPGVFTFTRTGSTAAALAIQFTLGGSATNGSDYAALTSPLTIPAGASSATLQVTPLQDTSFEGNETVVLTLSASSAYVVGSPSSATVTIEDDDPAPVQTEVTILAAIPTASESGGSGRFTVTRTGATSSALSVYFATFGTADGAAGSSLLDYTPLAMPITIPAGASSASIDIVPVNDTRGEGSETVILALAAGPGYVVGAPSSATITIIDDDPLPEYELSIVATDPTASEADPSDATALFTVSRTGPTTSELGVSYGVGGTASNLSDYTLTPPSPWVTIPAGASSATIALSVANDALVEGTETVVLTLTQPQAPYGLGVSSSATVSLADDDAPAGSVVVSIDAAADGTVPESAAQDTAYFRIRRTGSLTSALPVYFAVSGTATNGVDYQLVPNSATIPAGSSFAYVMVRPINDTLDEGTGESAVLTLQPGSGYLVGSPSSASVGIPDDDGGGCLVGPSAMGAILLGLVGLTMRTGRRHRRG